MNKPLTFQNLIRTLQDFWADKGALVVPGYDMEMGAATLHPFTLRCLGEEEISLAYVQRCRRPKDCRGGGNSQRLGHYYQFQVLLKPSPDEMRKWYEESLQVIGFDLKRSYLKFICDNWASPTLGAAGVGWEIWMDGLEISQFTYFQKVCSQKCQVVSGEITYGLERICMMLQDVPSVYDMEWNKGVTYGDLFKREDKEFFKVYSTISNAMDGLEEIDEMLEESKDLCNRNLLLPAYDLTIKATHALNILDARGLLSYVMMGETMKKIRAATKKCGEKFLEEKGASNADSKNKP